MTARLAVLVSGAGTNLQAVLDACADGTLDAEVVLVVSNRADAGGLDRAHRAGVDAADCVPSAGEERRDYDARLAEVVGPCRPDWVILAGWMRLLTMAFLGRFPNRVVNLHPARPGEFPGVDAIARAWRAGVDRTGVMVHLVPDEGVDDGPVLAVADVPIHPDDTLDDLTARVHAVEHRVLVSALADLVNPETGFA